MADDVIWSEFIIILIGQCNWYLLENKRKLETLHLQWCPYHNDCHFVILHQLQSICHSVHIRSSVTDVVSSSPIWTVVKQHWPHLIISSITAQVSDEHCCLAHPFIFKVLPHRSPPTPLAEGFRVDLDYFQLYRSCVQMDSWVCTVILHQQTLSHGRHWGIVSTSFCQFFVTGLRPPDCLSSATDPFWLQLLARMWHSLLNCVSSAPSTGRASSATFSPFPSIAPCTDTVTVMRYINLRFTYLLAVTLVFLHIVTYNLQ